MGFTQGKEGDGGSDEDRRERTEDNTKAHGEGETLDAFATQEQDAEGYAIHPNNKSKVYELSC